MASTNQSPFYKKAESMYLRAGSLEEKLKWLEEMIKECPKHKSSEKMLANLKTRMIKLKEKIESQKKVSRGSSKKGIKKEEMQAAIVGLTNSGKSTLLSILTNTKPAIGDYAFTTKYPEVGMMNYRGVQIQLVEIPAIESEYFNKSLVHTADTILILVNSLDQIEKIEKLLEKTTDKKIIIFNLAYQTEQQKRKIEATLKSKKYNFSIINTFNKEGLEELKEKIFVSFGNIRVFTKEPGKEKSPKPIILKPNPNVKEVAEKIFHGFSKQVKEARITGPSSKFPNQKVGLDHRLKDLDVVEFRTK